MPTRKLIVAALVACSSAITGSALAGPNSKPHAADPPGRRHVAVPELNGSSAAGAAVLVLGGLALVYRKRRARA